MAWARNGTPDTLGSAGDTLSITDLTAKKFNQIISHMIASGSLTTNLNIENDSSGNHAYRISVAGGADATATSSNQVQITGASVGDDFVIGYMSNISGEEKLAIVFTTETNTAGATTDPYRTENAVKYAVTSGQVTRIDLENSHSGNYDTNSNLTVLTGDETETVTLQNGTIFEESDTNKAYIWNASTKTWTQL